MSYFCTQKSGVCLPYLEDVRFVLIVSVKHGAPNYVVLVSNPRMCEASGKNCSLPLFMTICCCKLEEVFVLFIPADGLIQWDCIVYITTNQWKSCFQGKQNQRTNQNACYIVVSFLKKITSGIHALILL